MATTNDENDLQARWGKSGTLRATLASALAKVRQKDKDWSKDLPQNDGCVDLRFAPIDELSVDADFLKDLELGEIDARRASFKNLVLIGTKLAGSRLDGADFSGARLVRVDFSKASFRGSSFVRAKLDDVAFRRCDLHGADFANAELVKVDITGALTEGVRCKAGPAAFDVGIVLEGRDRWLNWETLRVLRRLPVFAVSWTGFSASITMMYLIEWANDVFGAYYAIPWRAYMVTVSSFLLLLGSSVFLVACPDRVQMSSLSEWMWVHRAPEILYRAEQIRRRKLQWVTCALTVPGGVMAVVLVVERAVALVRALVQ